MNGKIAAWAIVISATVAGIAIYSLQVHAFYAPASVTPGQDITLTTIESGQPEPILANAVTGIDAGNSPLGYRACFTTPLTQAMLSETYVAYDGAEPGAAPGWFACFDAMAIGAALARGEALAFLSQSNIAAEIDRVVAVFPDGRAFAWHQLNPAAKD
ncbi:MAG: histidine kinase [Rhodobacteraceae bacterium]|nr:histidine kinase [Paracoccaceae bacterium]